MAMEAEASPIEAVLERRAKAMACHLAHAAANAVARIWPRSASIGLRPA